MKPRNRHWISAAVMVIGIMASCAPPKTEPEIINPESEYLALALEKTASANSYRVAGTRAFECADSSRSSTFAAQHTAGAFKMSIDLSDVIQELVVGDSVQDTHLDLISTDKLVYLRGGYASILANTPGVTSDQWISVDVTKIAEANPLHQYGTNISIRDAKEQRKALAIALKPANKVDIGGETLDQYSGTARQADLVAALSPEIQVLSLIGLDHSQMGPDLQANPKVSVFVGDDLKIHRVTTNYDLSTMVSEVATKEQAKSGDLSQTEAPDLESTVGALNCHVGFKLDMSDFNTSDISIDIPKKDEVIDLTTQLVTQLSQ